MKGVRNEESVKHRERPRKEARQEFKRNEENTIKNEKDMEARAAELVRLFLSLLKE